MLLRTVTADPCREMAGRIESRRVWSYRLHRRSDDGPDTGNRHQSPHVPVAVGPRDDFVIEFSYAVRQPFNLLHDLLKRISGSLLYATNSSCEQLETPLSGISNNSKFRQLSAKRVRGLHSLTNEKAACAEYHRGRLLVSRFDGHEPHGLSRDGLGDSFRVVGIALSALHERLHVRRVDQANVMTELGDAARPLVRSATGFDPDEAWRQPLEKAQHFCSTEPAVEQRRAICVSAVHLKDIFSDV